MIKDQSTPPTNPKKSGAVGKRLGPRGLIAKVLLEQGATHRKVRELTGISMVTSVALKKQGLEELIDPAHAEAIRKNLRNRFAALANNCLQAVDKKKLKEAGVAELVRAASQAADRAGISAPSVIEHYYASLSEYVIHTNATPVLDGTPSTSEPASSSS